MEKRNGSKTGTTLMKMLDWYIIKKYLSTFFLAITLIICIAVIFDLTEKVDDIIERQIPTRAIIFEYYFNFIPFFVNLFSPLFVFVSVIFFTSKLAARTEIIAILAGGVSFKRFLFPYLLASSFITLLTFLLGNFVIPHANERRINFDYMYLKNVKYASYHNVFKQIKPNEVIFVESYDEETKTAFRFALEKFKNKNLVYKLNADVIKWDTISKSWKMDNYRIRTFKGEKEQLRSGMRLDTTLGFEPSEFKGLKSEVEMMNYHELNQFIADETAKGSDMVNSYLLEKHKRIAFPCATIILTFIAVPLASRKVRGGIGLNMGLGLGIAFLFIFLMQVSSVFATEGGVNPSIAVWIPNIFFGALAVYLLLKAPK